MAVSLVTTVGGLSLNDGVNYLLLDFDLGGAVRDEAWIEPWTDAAPVLAKKVDRKVRMGITLTVKGSSVADLYAKIEAVRNEFAVANTLQWNLGGGARALSTYPSAIDSVPLSNTDTVPGLSVATTQFLVPRWTFGVWRAPTYQGLDKTVVI